MPCVPPVAMADVGWPEATKEQKPWTRWWWLGSAVSEAEISRELEAFAGAGIGGVEICPIYGVQGQEALHIDFLSPRWMDILAHTAREAKRLGIGMDLTTGTGWPFGGPWVGKDTASAALHPWEAKVEAGKWPERPQGRMLVAMVRGKDGAWSDVTKNVTEGTPPPAEMSGAELRGLVLRSGIQQVKRAAPGAQGFVVDPFSKPAIDHYLARFDQAFAGFDAPFPRAHFHDSFEYYGASASPEMLVDFHRLRGYKLEDHLPELAGKGGPDAVTRVRADYRATMGEMHTGYLSAWHDWAGKTGSLTRNQAHGSPGNLLDHYAVADIPETEIFRHIEDNQLPMMRLAVSAAHATGRKLVSAESFTWLDEHFRVKPEELKRAADFLFLSGVNHLLFHGIPHSPSDAAWPGWLFYASTHMGPQGGLWRDLPAFNAYIRRCQSVLQSGLPSSDVLLYFPYHDILHDGAIGLPLFSLHSQNRWLWPTSYHRLAMQLMGEGYTLDSASDALLQQAEFKNGKIQLGLNAFEVLVVPKTRHMPVATMEKLLSLARAGAKVCFQENLPEDVPGLVELDARRAKLRSLRDEAGGIPSLVVMPADPGPALASLKIRRERWAGEELRFIRRRVEDGYWYFLVNPTDHPLDEVIELGVRHAAVVRLDPWSDKPGMLVESSVGKRGHGPRVVLEPGASVVLRTFDKQAPSAAKWSEPAKLSPMPVGGPWRVEFMEGGPTRPEPFTTHLLGSWTTLGLMGTRDFSGSVRYSANFDLREKPARRVFLDLGRVEVTARVSVNGKNAGTCWFPPYRLDVTDMLGGGNNQLVIEVTNLAANRIARMDRVGEKWKIFHEINFVSIRYGAFDASSWLPMDSGLCGPVSLLMEE